MTLGGLDHLAATTPELAAPVLRCRAMLMRLGLASTAGDPAFPGLDGAPLSEPGYAARMGELRAVRINMEFGGALCRGLKASRYKEAVEVDGEPTLVDFILERAPARAASD